jgi:hypothetical protein
LNKAQAFQLMFAGFIVGVILIICAIIVGVYLNDPRLIVSMSASISGTIALFVIVSVCIIRHWGLFFIQKDEKA